MFQIAKHVKILPPTDDRVFKSLLTKDCVESKIILMDIINSIIGVEVLDVKVKNNEPAKDDTHEKQESLDINCTIDSGELINIEMYANTKGDLSGQNYKLLKNKSVYYGTDLFSSQNLRGKSYDEIVKTYQITFTAYSIFKNDDNFIHEFKLRDLGDEVLTNDLSFIFIELSKLKNTLNKPVEEMTALEKWGIFLQYADKRDKIETINRIIKTKGEIAMGSTLLQSISQDEFEQARMMSRRKFQTDMESARIINERKVKVAMAEGMAEGMAKGMEKSKLAIAKNLLQFGMDIEEITNMTGLSKEEINKL